MSDPRYEEPVGGLDPDALGRVLRGSVADVQARLAEYVSPKKIGICVFVFDFGDPAAGAPHGFGYISNAQRSTMLEALREFMAREAKQS